VLVTNTTLERARMDRRVRAGRCMASFSRAGKAGREGVRQQRWCRDEKGGEGGGGKGELNKGKGEGECQEGADRNLGLENVARKS
jgi:hypothetical protein